MSVEQREVLGFDRVLMEDVGTLVITQGVQESLTIDTDLDLKDVYTEVHHGVLTLRLGRSTLERLSIAFENALSWPRVQYRLGVKQLHGLTVAGAGRVECAALNTQTLQVKLAGVGSVLLQALAANELEVELAGGGQVQVAGKTEQQRVLVSGVGGFDGAALESQRAQVRISGTGRVVVWTEQELEAHLSGMGTLEYRGNPRLSRRLSGLGSISRLGESGHTTMTGPAIQPPPLVSPQARRPPRPPFAKG